ncbi:MAG: pantoate--beta-alanine ligase [Bacteroidetes bacterium]|nr:MAG: pantoate--beta-alanine ligase [Bacteroidota bacterium]TAG89099.1 MAG: pantoate--beta-alanine ligase [Bacteroidota bacterium]
MTQKFTTIDTLKSFLREQKLAKKNWGFVPTMGALHEGHLQLVKKASEENDFVVVSIFVNPTQFNNVSDLEKYPRNIDKDIQLLETLGKQIVVFTPETKEMYPHTSILKFDFGNLENVMEGSFRAGHFNGVALVVSKLFHIVQPKKAYFGQKDLQQCRVIGCLVRDLDFDLELVICPTMRENDGLAMSSRNTRLDANQRKEAVKISQSLFEAEKKIKNKENWVDILAEIETFYKNSDLRLEYFLMADNQNLTILNSYQDQKKVAICVAAYAGEVRLIDNIVVEI